MRRLEYVSPATVVPAAGGSPVFKAGSIRQGKLAVCTQTEILVIDLEAMEVQDVVSAPLFNDLHHVAWESESTVLVAVTGVDLVARVNLRAGRVEETWRVVEDGVFSRYPVGTDFRRLATTKPHKAHPNYVFRYEKDWWVTRFEQRDAVSLGAPRRRIAVDVERPHDGVVRGGSVFFTTVDGHVVRAGSRRERRRVWDLGEFYGKDCVLGWCRGLDVVSENGIRAWVGFSRLRDTRYRENIRWVARRVRLAKGAERLGTRVALVDLEGGRVLRELDLECHGMNAVFSVHEVGSDGG